MEENIVLPFNFAISPQNTVSSFTIEKKSTQTGNEPETRGSPKLIPPMNIRRQALKNPHYNQRRDIEEMRKERRASIKAGKNNVNFGIREQLVQPITAANVQPNTPVARGLNAYRRSQAAAKNAHEWAAELAFRLQNSRLPSSITAATLPASQTEYADPGSRFTPNIEDITTPPAPKKAKIADPRFNESGRLKLEYNAEGGGKRTRKQRKHRRGKTIRGRK